jgi:UDP-N-acetylmuramoyl-tripeptide--D-alanyl-D-alanine ligase
VIPLRLAEVAELARGVVGAGGDDTLVTAPPAADSRQTVPGGLFVAVRGERVDGHEYVEQALAGGAVASLVSRPVPGPHVLVDDPVAAVGRLARAVVDRLVAGGLRVVGVTGSSGKTSTKDLLAHLLSAAGPTVAPAGSLNTEIGVPLTALRADADTRYLVVEMGARGAGHIAYLCDVTPPQVGVVLNVGSAHAGEFGGREATARAKAELVAALPAAAAGGVAVLNADDPLVAAMAADTAARVVTVGADAEADVRAGDVRLDERGRPTYVLQAAGGGPVPVTLPLHGAHHVANSLAAAAVALESGLRPAEVAALLGGVPPSSRWRMEVSERADGLLVVNDAYNANPDSVRAALAALGAMAAGRRTWAVLGEMLELGAASTAEHEEVGRLARRSGVDRLVVVGEGARAVHAGALAEGAVEGEESVVVADVPAALALLASAVRPGDVVLVKASRGVGLERVAEGLLGGLGRDRS